MKYLAMSMLVVVLLGGGAVLVTPQDVGPQEEKPVLLPARAPEFIVVYHLSKDTNNEDAMVDLRVVIREENEYAAVVKSVRALYAVLPDHMARKAKFIEVAVKRPNK